MNGGRLSWSADRFLAGLADAAVTYPEVGATAAEPLPEGYRHLRHRALIGEGEAAFRTAAQTLMTWRLHRRAGMQITCADQMARPGSSVVLGLGPRPARLIVACRVVYTVTENRRWGFAYGTLPGHPETGEEAFILEWQPAGAVVLEITAFSRPATWYARIGGPLNRLAQDMITSRYLNALLAPPR